LRACAAPGAGGPALAAAARLFAALSALQEDAAPIDLADLPPNAGHDMPSFSTLAAASGLPEAACLIIADALGMAVGNGPHARRTRPSATTGQEPYFSRFAGLLLLTPGLDFAALADGIAAWPDAAPDTAALIGFASLGLCAGRANFSAWLRESCWRRLFCLDERATGAELAARLNDIPEQQWQMLAPLAPPPAAWHEAKFLLAPRRLLNGKDPAGARIASKTLAALANGLGQKFVRRLTGLRAASAPFLWDNLLSAGGVLEAGDNGWQARLNRPPLDVLLSLSRLADGSVTLPHAVVRLSRVMS
jgi:hypothetical protein